MTTLSQHRRSVLVTGALGQIGSELVPALRRHFGEDRVVSPSRRSPPPGGAAESGPHERLDCSDPRQLHDVIARHDVGMIYHLAALLSATADAQPQLAWNLDMCSLYNVLEAARADGCRVFFPSSIGAFGPTTPQQIELMEADMGRLLCRNAYNVAAISVTPAELAAEVRRHIAIAESWRRTLDDSAARADWGWHPRYDLAATTADMLAQLAARSAAARGG